MWIFNFKAVNVSYLTFQIVNDIPKRTDSSIFTITDWSPHELLNACTGKARKTFQIWVLQISAFFLFSNIRKGRLLYIRPVGRLVGWLVDVTINSFNIYRHKSPLLTQYHSIPISTNQYQVILTQYHLVTTSITPYWPSTIKYQPVLPCKGPVLSYIMMSIATVSIDHNWNKRFALFTWSSFYITSAYIEHFEFVLEIIVLVWWSDLTHSSLSNIMQYKQHCRLPSIINYRNIRKNTRGLVCWAL